MSVITRIFVLLLCFIFISSCQKKKIIVINNKKLIVDIADTEEKRRKGLMFRKEMNEDEGMLFKFNNLIAASFWMKNTFIPLSIAFINTNFKIIGIHDMSPLDEETRHSSIVPVKYALEVNQGWFKKNGIKIGDLVEGIEK